MTKLRRLTTPRHLNPLTVFKGLRSSCRTVGPRYTSISDAEELIAQTFRPTEMDEFPLRFARLVFCNLSLLSSSILHLQLHSQSEGQPVSFLLVVADEEDGDVEENV